MTENAAASTDPARAEEAVTERARAGIATICVAVFVAVLTLGLAVGTLFVTGLVPLPGLQDRISAAISDRLGRDWEVQAGEAELRRIDGRAQLQLQQVSFRHTSGAVIRAPQALVGYDPLALLTGQLKLVSVDLRGVNVRLGVDRDGALLLSADTGAAAAPPPAALPDPGQWSGFAGVMAAVSALNTGDGLLGSIETAGIRGARLTLVDPDGRVTAGLEDVDIRLSRAGEGVSRLTLSGRVGQRWKELSIDLTRAADGSRRAAMHVQRFEPAEIIALAAGSKAARLEGLTLSGDVVLTESAAGERSVAADLAIDPGSVRFGDTPLETVAIDGARLRVVSDGSLKRYRAEQIEIRAGATRLAGTGAVRDEGGSWGIDLDLAGTLAGAEAADSVVLVDTFKGRLAYDEIGGATRIEALTVKGPSIDAEATGLLRRSAEGLHQEFSIRALKSDARAVLAVWPAFSSPEVHGVLRQRLRAGLMERVDVRIDLDPAGHATLVKGQGMPASALEVRLAGTGVTFLPGDGLPELRDATVEGLITGRTAQITVPRATAPISRDRSLALSEGSFALADIWLPRTPAKIAFRTQGPVEALLGLFAYPALREFAPQGIEPGSLRGQSDLKSTLSLPLADDIKASEVVVQSAGTLSNLSSDTLLGTEKLDSGQLAISYDAGGLQAKGDARIGGDRGQVEIRQNAKGQGEATIALVLDNAARQKRGFGPDAGIGGVVTARVVKPLARGSDSPPRIELDFAKASIDGTVPGLGKAVGRPGKASFVYVADSDGPDLEQFVFEAGSVSIRGKIELNRQNGLDSASLSQLKLSPGDNLRAEIRRDGGVTKATIRGAVADARPFIQDLLSPAGSQSRGKDAKGPDLDLDVEVPIVTGHNSEAITNFAMKASLRGGDVRSLTMDGRLGRADVTARHSRQGAGGLLVVQTGNGGALLRFADLYKRAQGGQLFLSTGLGDGRQSGELLYRDFVVRDEPALRRVIGGSRQAGADGQNANPLDGSDVAFTKLRAEFTRSAGRLDVSEMVLWGQQVGFTLQGNVDFGRDRVDIGGTFVPGYAFNNAFAQVPVVGAILGGGSQYGGLFAVNFRISGAASAPTMSINPLSAIAPGILRRFVDPLGGAPAQRPIQPSGPGAPPPGAAAQKPVAPQDPAR